MRYLICIAAAIPLLTACGDKKSEEPLVPPPATVAPGTTAPPAASPPPAAPTAAPTAEPHAESLPATPQAAAPKAAGGQYVVAKGDTLYAIAKKQGVKPKDILRWNGIKDPRRIRVGQKLRLTAP